MKAEPRETADKYNRVIVNDLRDLGLSYDLFTRTTTLNHYAVVQDLFLGLHRNGYVVPKITMGAVSPSTGRTLPDRYIEAPARSADTPVRAVISATTAATSWTRST